VFKKPIDPAANCLAGSEIFITKQDANLARPIDSGGDAPSLRAFRGVARITHPRPIGRNVEARRPRLPDRLEHTRGRVGAAENEETYWRRHQTDCNVNFETDSDLNFCTATMLWYQNISFLAL
jgi:hypothetical protein